MLNLCDGGIHISTRKVMESFYVQLILASGRRLMRNIIWNLERNREIFGFLKYGCNEPNVRMRP
jgi:hypothetical protein